MSKRTLDGVFRGTLGTGTLSCSQRGFTSPSTLNQFPTARWKHQNSMKCMSGIPCHSNSTTDHDHQNEGCEFSTNTEQNSFSVVTSFGEALKMPKMQSPEKRMRVYMQVAVYQWIITFINSFSFLVPINRDISEGSFQSGQTNWY